MLEQLARVTTVNAVSVIGDDKVVNMRANIAEDGSISFGKTVRNAELYVSNREQCDSDYADFETEVLKLAQA